MASDIEVAAMRRALEHADAEGLPTGPNPRVGCVLLDSSGAEISIGAHRGAGTPHAEVVALSAAGARAAGATAVVTLEPCTHVGRTPPCTDALVAAGVARVVYAQADASDVAAGGAAVLRAAGIDVEGGVLAAEAIAVNPYWTFAVTEGRPFVTWKMASTLDGRVAAADGSSRWITGPQARADVHRLRALADAIVVGTGTVRIDDPALTVRTPRHQQQNQHQPLRVVVGRAELPAGARVLDAEAPTLQLRTHDVDEVLAALQAREIRHVLLEGGPTLAAAFVRADRVDRIVAYVAPALLGAGPAALQDAGIATISQAVRLETEDVETIDGDVRITARVARTPARGRA